MAEFQHHQHGPDESNDPPRTTNEQRFDLTFLDEGVEHVRGFNALRGRKWDEPRTGFARPRKEFWQEAEPLMNLWREHIVGLARAAAGMSNELNHEQRPGTGNELTCGDSWMTLHTFTKSNGTFVVPSIYPFQERMVSASDDMLTDVIPSGEILRSDRPGGILRKFYLLHDDYPEPNSVNLDKSSPIASAGTGARLAMKVDYRFSPETMPDLLRNLEISFRQEPNLGSILREMIVQKAANVLRHQLEIALRQHDVEPLASFGENRERLVIDDCMSRLMLSGLRERFHYLGHILAEKGTAVVNITVPKIPSDCSRDELMNLEAGFLHKQRWMCSVKIDEFNRLSVRSKVVKK